MQTNRFETFFDAVLAIIITVLVLKLAQPQAATLDAIWSLNSTFLTYFMCFLIIFNIWYNNHTLLYYVDEIDNSALWIYGALIFTISLLPYFSSWLTDNMFSIPAQTLFGAIFVAVNLLSYLAIYAISKSNQNNTLLRKMFENNLNSLYISLTILLVGFILTYTVFIPAVYISCIIMVAYRHQRSDFQIFKSERFEALIDAIVAIILTIIVLEIAKASGGTWQAIFDLKLEFLAYAISFIVCFNYWNFNNNIFADINEVNHQVIWSVGFSLFALSLIPYLTIFVSRNFFSFIAQAVYGLDFILIALLNLITFISLRQLDEKNSSLKHLFMSNIVITLIFVSVGLIIGYIAYPPAVMFACLISIIAIWFKSYLSSNQR